tara:strand:- start:137 stop:451 length:315 start_codon:yes stop_codon:yes gene_type:complete
MWLPPELWEIIFQYKKDIEEYEEIKQNKKNVVSTINKYTLLIDNEDIFDFYGDIFPMLYPSDLLQDDSIFFNYDDVITYYDELDLELIDYPLFYKFSMFIHHTI